MKWENSKVLVTGGAGFIGSHLVERLLDLGSDVYIADNFSRGTRENIKEYEEDLKIYPLDLTKLENCLIATSEVDYVFHLAASVGGIHYLKRENVGGLTPNLLMNTNMLEAARFNDIKNFLFASSACVYREQTKELSAFKEEDCPPANPQNTYGWAKVMGELACQAYHEDYGLNCFSVRLFNVYGEKENLDPKWSHVIPSLIRKAIRYPKEGFKLFGDGGQERAFLYIDDCVEGLLRSMDRIKDGSVINIGNGPEEAVSINELAAKIIDLSGKEIDIEHDLSAPEGTYKYCANTEKMKEKLNWHPTTPLDTGLKKVYTWANHELEGA